MEKTPDTVWQQFQQKYSLNNQQLAQFKQYYELMITYNEDHNLTTITKLSNVIDYHYTDSIVLTKTINMANITGLVDIGSGAGFPGIPLKILYPTLPVILIEVTLKKINFLELVIETLNLTGIEVYRHDWRTFLRTTNYTNSNLFCARASLVVPELFRLFKPGCTYKNSTLVYWANHDYQPENELNTAPAGTIIKQIHPYKVGQRERKLVAYALQL